MLEAQGADTNPVTDVVDGTIGLARERCLGGAMWHDLDHWLLEETAR